MKNSKGIKKTLLAYLIILIILAGGIASWVFKPNLAQAGKVVFKRNVVFRAFYKPTLNGSLATSTNVYPQSLGGVDDYNNNQTMPSDSYLASWTVCAAGNSWCGTNDSAYAYAKDNSTGLIWSIWLDSGTTHTWFWANNCAYPNGLAADGVCNTNGEPACQCVKLTSSKTGCEALGSGWRLPHQKELMQVYIDGSWGNLSSPGYFYWSATTLSNYTQYAWYMGLDFGYTDFNSKTGTLQVRCVRW